ncbi:putative cuticular protein [Danaus plexippus plexippus]|uniref:Cuticular protein n=1 Tax=Danaus plexippus plexippus TaxID=278856 RepID=A0A212FJ09_DANPL|nr:putative cuticular protein [Danaus plexippus plexippus]
MDLYYALIKTLIAFVAILGYASASAILSPLVVGPNPGDVQAAVIDANVAARDAVRTIGEGQARAAEAAIQYNTEAVRQVAEANRNLQENAYWGSVAASQNLVAAAQSQAAAVDGAAAAVRAAYAGAPLGYAGGLALPYAAAPLGLAGLAYGGLHGLRAW